MTLDAPALRALHADDRPRLRPVAVAVAAVITFTLAMLVLASAPVASDDGAATPPIETPTP